MLYIIGIMYHMTLWLQVSVEPNVEAHFGILMGIFDGNPGCLFLDLWYFRWRGTSLSARNCLLSLRMFPLYSGEPPGGHLQSSHTNQLLSLSKQSNNYKIAFGFYAVLWCFFKKVGIEALLDDNYNFYDNIGRVHSWILTFVIFRCASILIHPHVSILLQPYGQ